MSKIKAIIFDLDGTLIDSVTDLANSVNYTLEKLDLPLHTNEEIKSFVGDGVQKLIKRSLGLTHMDISRDQQYIQSQILYSGKLRFLKLQHGLLPFYLSL